MRKKISQENLPEHADGTHTLQYNRYPLPYLGNKREGDMKTSESLYQIFVASIILYLSTLLLAVFLAFTGWLEDGTNTGQALLLGYLMTLVSTAVLHYTWLRKRMY